MRSLAKLLSLLLLTAAFSIAVAAQDSTKTEQNPPAASQSIHFYRLELMVQEVDATGKVTNGRTYHLTASTERGVHNSVRAESRVPISTGSSLPDGKESTQFQYQDIGVRIDSRDTKEVDRSLAFFCTVSVSSIANPANTGSRPILRSYYWDGPVFIPIGKPVVIFTADSTDSKGAMQVVVTATPLQ